MKVIKVILKTYLLVIFIFSFFRIMLFLFHSKEVFADGISTLSDVLSVFFVGLRYDIMISTYLLLIPYFLLIAYDFTHKNIFRKTALWWVFIFFGLSFMLTAANVVYYNKFYQFININAFRWFDSTSTVLGMIFHEPRYWWMFVPYFIILYLFYRLLKKIYQMDRIYVNYPRQKKYLMYFAFFVLMFIGMRGRIGSHPLRTEDAFTLHNNFLNELKLNPVFVLVKAYENYLKDKLHPMKLMDEDKAIQTVQKYMHIEQPVNDNPVSRKIDSLASKPKKNVVLILMESMATWKMGYFGNTENRTPFLDSLFQQGIGFTNMYSTGTHTFAGVYGVNYAYPLIFDKHPLKGLKVKKYYGIPNILKDNGYQTEFFIPHNKHFDNLGIFLSENGYDKVYFEKDYPKDSIRTIWGVDDHFLFNFALKKIDKLYARNQPFLATILTISDHGPFYVPDYIEGETEEIRATRFADWSLRKFFEKAENKAWFDNTVFILVADHGRAHNAKYPIPLTYNHIPAVIYYKGVQHQIIDKMTGQVDILPSLMNVLQIDYLNQTFGQDAFSETRPYIFFNHDQKYGLIDKEFLMVIERHKTIGMYKYKEDGLTDYREKMPEKAKEMETYLKAHIQTAQYILDNNLQAPPLK